MWDVKMIRLACVVGLVAAVIVIPGVASAGPKPQEPPVPTVDGLLDESYVFVKHFEGSEDDRGFAPGDLYKVAPADDAYCYWALVVPRSYNDNVYSPDKNDYLADNGWTVGHSFSDLEESDGAEFDVDCGTGTTTVWLDYLNSSLGHVEGRDLTKSEFESAQYESGTAADDYGSLIADPIVLAATSLYYNMTNPSESGYGESDGWSGWNDEEDAPESPPKNYNSDTTYYYEWRMIYEFAIGKVNDQCCEVIWAGAHNSPSKNGNDSLASLGDYVWLDSNGNGQQDEGQLAGVPNVTVELYVSGGTDPLATTQTDEHGYYYFTGLDPDSYYVKFYKPSGYAFTEKNAAGTSNLDDSDADQTTGQTAVTTLAAGDNDLSWDAGLVSTTDVTVSSFEAESGASPRVLLGMALLAAAGSVLAVKRRRRHLQRA